jgi:hypothetical protein
MDANFTVIYDACVLYPAPLRDLLMELALTGLFQARWTERIHDEWTRNVLKNRPDLTMSQMNRTRSMMNEEYLEILLNQGLPTSTKLLRQLGYDG